MKKAIRQLYDILPFKKQLFTLLRNFDIPEKIYRHLSFKGVIRVPVDNHSFRIFHHGYSLENELFWKGVKGWDRHALEQWIKLSRMSDVIFDIGANTGIFALVSGAANPKARIFAFEPVSRVFEKLKGNVALNEFDITPLQVAASNKNGESILYDSTDEHNLSASLNPKHRPGSLQTKIQSQTLDSFIADKIIRVDLVKIDVERHEPDVIEGFLQSIKKFLPSILIEVLDQDIAEKLDRLFQGLPYLYFSIDEEKGLRRVQRMEKNNSVNYLICTTEVAGRIGLQLDSHA